MLNGITFEVCCGSLTDILTANRFPVDRIEVNSALELGGCTASQATFAVARSRCSKKLLCMVRPRAAGFIYNSIEIETMFLDAKAFLEAGADGIVFGFLNPDSTIDVETSKQMVDLIHGYHKEAVFHKAFDETPDPMVACEQLIQIGVDRILTSGQQPTVLQGAACLNQLIETYSDQIEILPGGGIRSDNVLEVLQATGSKQLHFSAKTMCTDIDPYPVVSATELNAILTAIHSLPTPHDSSKEISGEDSELLQEEAYEETIQPAFDAESDRN